MAGPFDHLHIKGRTAGSSNELSFDVLDAAASGVDSRKQRSLTGRKSSRGTYAGVGSASTLSAVPEVERRKRVRRHRAIRMWVIGIVVVVALAATGGYFGYRAYQDRVAFTSHFDALVEQFVEVDKTLVEVDRLMMNPLNSVELEKRKQILDAFPGTTARLEGIDRDAKEMMEDSAISHDDVTLTSVRSAVAAREDMLVIAVDAFKLSEIVNNQVKTATEAWNKVLSGDSAVRQATQIANSATTEEATIEARDRTQNAREMMGQARKELELLTHEVEGVDFAEEIAYIDKRIEALDAAVDTANALLAGDRNAAATSNTAYNTADGAAALLASGLPDSIGELVKSQYVDQMQALVDSYRDARSQASVSDGAIRAKR